MLKNDFEIRDQSGAYIKVRNTKDGEVNIEIKSPTEYAGYYRENMTLTLDSVRGLIEALQEAID